MANTFHAFASIGLAADYVLDHPDEVIQELAIADPTAFGDGSTTLKCNIMYAEELIHTGTTINIDLNPLVDKWGTANAWNRVRLVYLRSRDVLTSLSNRLLRFGGTFVRSVILQNAGATTSIGIPAGGAQYWEQPASGVGVAAGVNDVISIDALNVSVGNPLTFRLVLFGTK